MKEKKRKKSKRVRAIVLGVFLFVIVVLCGLQAGSIYTERIWEHWYPDYEKVEISPLLTKTSLTEEDYELLYRQTGVTKLGIDQMRDTPEGRKRILHIQEVMFSPIEVEGRAFAPFTYMDEIVTPVVTAMSYLKDGDIIVSATTRVSWWRYGHAAIVVDGENGIIAECAGPGEKSSFANVRVYGNFADFMVLRPKLPDAVKTQLAEYVKTEMMDVTYRFTTGILTKKYPEELKISQCAHYVWYAYKKFGVDLDSNGGGLVKAQDMALSPHVEVVQAFGFNLDTLWS